MSDSYLAISEIAKDTFMIERLRACAAQQGHNGLPIGDPLQWVDDNRYVWASSPSWGEKWTYALLTNEDKPNYEPGRDPAVITDEDILATVQFLAPTG
jgi:hypothetical protein